VQDAKLFDWLVNLYEVWKRIDGEAVYWSSILAMGELLKDRMHLLHRPPLPVPAGRAR
jgi:hypothetical protein